MHAASLDIDDGLDEIVAGVAHDFANILAVVTNYLALVSKRIDDPETGELLDKVRMAAHRASRLTRELHELGDSGVLESEPVSVNPYLRDVRVLLDELLSSTCTLQLDLADDPVTALANRTGLEIVLRHLVQNACDSMSSGGVVTVATRAIDGGGAELSVSDTGSGMPAEVVERATEPRFSTRPKGQSAGLGLAIVDRVARRLGAELQIDSVEGSGTTVRLRFPGVTNGG